MNVLGISPLDKDSTVTIVEDGRMTYAASEERFTRVKLQDGFPWQSLQAGLEQQRLGAKDVDVVAYPFFDWDEETRLFRKNLENEREFIDESKQTSRRLIDEALSKVPARDGEIPGLTNPNERVEKGFAKSFAYRLLASDSVISRNVAKRASEQWGRDATAFHRKWQEELEAGLEELGLRDKLKRVEHHQTHAANAYLTSGYDEALIVTLDGYGSGLAGSVSVGRGGRIERLHGVEYPHSLGTFYESVTSALGFKPSRHEGKIVGLAAYGDPSILRDVLLSRFDIEPGNFRIRESNNLFFARLLAAEFPKIDVAAAYQHVLEIVATRYVAHFLRQTGLRHLVLSGGVVANVKLNQRLRELDGVDGVFIHPNMGDGGCGTGAAFAQFDGHPALREPIGNVFLGPGYSDAEIEAALKTANLAYQRVTPIEEQMASLIAGGKVVARFSGRMEYGPRALGHRSILYHAKEPAVNQWLNQRLGRTEFMPFAPATLFEHRHDCYQRIEGCEHAALFMTITFDCTERMKAQSPAAVHVDGTARPQLVTAESNPTFYKVLTAYHALTGIPSLINTSFNMHKEPIVCTPHDAIRAFIQGNLDYLAIGDFLVPHPAQGTVAR